MQPNAHGLVLTATRKDGDTRPLVPEEAPEFELHLRNDGKTAQTADSMIGGLFAPTFRLLDRAGNELGSYTPSDRGERNIGDLTQFSPPTPRPVTLAPGAEQTIVVSLWAHREAAPPGEYGFDAQHPVDDALLTSNRVAFKIVPAQVYSMALSYDTAQRTNSVLAWLTEPAGAKDSRLLIRISGFSSHRSAQVGATANGDFPSDSRLAAGAKPTDSTSTPALGWVAVVSGDKLHLLEHSMSEPRWQAPAVTLPLTDAVPVPRFPDRVHAVFLATGMGKQGPALVGVVAQEKSPALKPWLIPLTVAPLHSACVFTMQGIITLLFSSDDGKTSRLHRVDFDEDGKVAAPERVVRETPNEVLAMVADMRSGAPISFVVLEASREMHDQLAFAKLPLMGQPMVTALQVVAGWPTTEVGARKLPARAKSLTLEMDNDGLPWLALVDSEGDLIGGRGNSNLSVFREGKKRRCVLPQIGALARSTTISCFNPDGTLFHAGSDPEN